MTEAVKDEAFDLLRKCAAQFRFYERNHRDKAVGLRKLAGAEKQVADTLAKAEANRGFAREIEEFLGEDVRSSDS